MSLFMYRIYIYIYALLSHFSHVWPFVTLWTIDCQASLPMGLSRHEYWSGLPCSPPGNLPNPETEPASLMSPALAGRFFTTSVVAMCSRKQTHSEGQCTWWNAVCYTSRPKAEFPLSQGPQQVFVKTSSTLSVSGSLKQVWRKEKGRYNQS